MAPKWPQNGTKMAKANISPHCKYCWHCKGWKIKSTETFWICIRTEGKGTEIEEAAMEKHCEYFRDNPNAIKNTELDEILGLLPD